MNMMKEHPMIAGYWSARKESRQKIVEDIIRILDTLSSLGVCKEWVYPGIKRTLPKARVIFEKDSIDKHLRAQKTDIEKENMEDLGFSFNCWSGDNNNKCSLTVSNGIFWGSLNNSVIIELHEIHPRDHQKFKLFAEIQRQLILVFDPDYSVVTSHEFYDRSGRESPFTEFGYIAYEKASNKFKFNEIDHSWIKE